MAAYAIINAIGRIAHSQSQWETVDIAKYKIAILYKRYDTLRVTLKNNYTKEVGWLSLDDVDTVIPQDKTFKEYLDMIGDKALPLKKGTLTIKKHIQQDSRSIQLNQVCYRMMILAVNTTTVICSLRNRM